MRSRKTFPAPSHRLARANDARASSRAPRATPREHDRRLRRTTQGGDRRARPTVRPGRFYRLDCIHIPLETHTIRVQRPTRAPTRPPRPHPRPHPRGADRRSRHRSGRAVRSLALAWWCVCARFERVVPHSRARVVRRSVRRDDARGERRRRRRRRWTRAVVGGDGGRARARHHQRWETRRGDAARF